LRGACVFSSGPVTQRKRIHGPFLQRPPLNQVKANQGLTKRGETAMKSIAKLAFFAIANLALVGSSYAQSNGVQATVPFDFTVSNKLLPAGTYSIKQQRGTHVIEIRNRYKAYAALTIVDQDGNRSPKGGRLLFNRYGDQYFLSEILCDDADMNYKLPTSKTEKKTRLDEARLKTASQTLVAAR
jgi:hypothetical protein